MVLYNKSQFSRVGPYQKWGRYLGWFSKYSIQKTLTKNFNICVTDADAYSDAYANRRLSTILVPSKITKSQPFFVCTLGHPRRSYMMNFAEIYWRVQKLLNREVKKFRGDGKWISRSQPLRRDKNAYVRKSGITQSKIYGIGSKVNQFIYILVCNYMPNIRILALAVLQIFCSQGCSYIIKKGA